MQSVLFVCSANICRSPMAMGLWQAKVQGQADAWLVNSAGVWALVGSAPAKYSVQLLRERGIDISTHRSIQITSEMTAQYQLTLVMEKNHKEALQAAFPAFASRIYMLSEMVDERKDIIDPIGRELPDYRDTMREIERIFTLGYERIIQLAR